MIPLRDDIPSLSVPWVNYALILINAAVFLYELTLGPRVLQELVTDFGVIPAHFLRQPHPDAASWWPAARNLFTALFLHGGWLHLLGNMLYLWIFGDNVEDRLGHVRYLVFYLLCGAGANIIQIVLRPDVALPTIGASGAIAGVLGAYLVLYPNAFVIALVPIFFFVQLIRVPALFFLLFWFIQQFFLAALSPAGFQAGVAWWAHIGGFGLGLVLGLLLQRSDRRPASRDEWWRRLAG